MAKVEPAPSLPSYPTSGAVCPFRLDRPPCTYSWERNGNASAWGGNKTLIPMSTNSLAANDALLLAHDYVQDAVITLTILGKCQRMNHIQFNSLVSTYDSVLRYSITASKSSRFSPGGNGSGTDNE